MRGEGGLRLEAVVVQAEGAALSAQERGEYLAVAQRQCERLGRLVEDLFEFSRLEGSQERLAMEASSVTEWVSDNVQAAHLAAQQKGVRLETDFSLDPPFVRRGRRSSRKTGRRFRPAIWDHIRNCPRGKTPKM